ncbi:mitochondrial ribosomal protein L23 [Trametopsis cervina]|nr:mitochondrial ribosomal protein L23 [Trametopsis cervina]
MQAAFRRLYSSIPDAAASARTSSTPRAVRLRRLRKREPIAPGESDASPAGSTPSELARYKRDLAKGELINEEGKYLTEEEWLKNLNERRTRVRGARPNLSPGSQEQLEVVGQKIYLPNILFRLVRNHTPPGQPYNPYEATFRIPQSVTKTDVRSYLSSVYGVKTTYIRTDNYLSPVGRSGATDSYKTYKRAVVGLVDPFYYPLAMEDMTKEERAEREKWIEEKFQVKAQEEARKLFLLRLTRAQSKGWKWRTGSTAQRGNILRLIADRRALREAAIADAKSRIVRPTAASS